MIIIVIIIVVCLWEPAPSLNLIRGQFCWHLPGQFFGCPPPLLFVCVFACLCLGGAAPPGQGPTCWHLPGQLFGSPPPFWPVQQEKNGSGSGNGSGNATCYCFVDCPAVLGSLQVTIPRDHPYLGRLHEGIYYVCICVAHACLHAVVAHTHVSLQFHVVAHNLCMCLQPFELEIATTALPL